MTDFLSDLVSHAVATRSGDDLRAASAPTLKPRLPGRFEPELSETSVSWADPEPPSETIDRRDDVRSEPQPSWQPHPPLAHDTQAAPEAIITAQAPPLASMPATVVNEPPQPTRSAEPASLPFERRLMQLERQLRQWPSAGEMSSSATALEERTVQRDSVRVAMFRDRGEPAPSLAAASDQPEHRAASHATGQLTESKHQHTAGPTAPAPIQTSPARERAEFGLQDEKPPANVPTQQSIAQAAPRLVVQPAAIAPIVRALPLLPELHAQSQPAAPAPTIHVTIGRVEVRANVANMPPRRPARMPEPSPLEAYLQRKAGAR